MGSVKKKEEEKEEEINNVLFFCVFSRQDISDFVTQWTAAHQTPLLMGFARQEYCSGFALPSFRGSSQPRDQTRVFYISCIGRQVLHH